MNFRSTLTRFFKFFKKKKKENLLTGSLLFISAVISLLPGSIHLINGIDSLTFSIITFNDYVSIIMFSLLMFLPSFVLFSVSYLLWEGHSLGWKSSIAICAIAGLIGATNSSSMYFALPIALLSGLAVILQIRNGRKNGSQTKDSPIVTENVVKLGLRLSIIACIGIVVAMLIFIVAIASPFLSINFFTSMQLNLQNVQRICQGLPAVGSTGGVLGYALGSLILVIFCEFIAVPIGIFAAIYLAEYSSQGRVVSTIRFFIEVLAGAPSIVIAVIGFSIFAVTLDWGYSLWSAAIALSFMALPWNIRVAEESIKAVPRSYREASFALGATQWQTARQVMLYAALPGIVTGILLGIGVALGETLVLLFTYTGTSVSTFPTQWWRIFNTHQQLPSLTVFILNSATTQSNYYSGSGLPGGNQANKQFFTWSLALAAAVVLITIYLVLCVAALLLRNYLNKRMKGS